MDTTKLDKIIAVGEEAFKVLESNEQVKDEITNLAEDFAFFAKGAKELVKEGEILKIGVVGQVKAGKSSFLNSLLFNGDDVLPKASTPMTAGLTIMEYSENEEYFETEYYSIEDWAEFEKANSTYEKIAGQVKESMVGAPDNVLESEIKKVTTDLQRSAHELVSMCKSSARSKIGSKPEKASFSGVKGLQSTLEKYVGSTGDYTPVVKSLHIYLNDERMKGIRIVDTPGVNDPIVSRENRTKEFLGSCHGVFFLSSATRFMDSQDVTFMNTRVASTGIGSIILLASKYDSVLQDIGLQFRGKPQEGDLDAADEYAQSRLKNSYSSKKREIEANTDKIIFDTTSGIGFSLAKKNAYDYDSVERNVLEQMRRFYPEAFTEEEYRDTFMSLANIDKIRDEYLEKEFKEKKDEIIGEKVNNFFNETGKSLLEKIKVVKAKIEARLQKILTSNIDELKKQKAEMQGVFDEISTKLPNVIREFQNNLQKKVNDFDQSIKFPYANSLIKLSEMQFECTCERDWGWFGNKTVVEYSKFVDTTASQRLIENAVDEYVKQWRAKWSANFKQNKDNLVKKYYEIISAFSMKTTNQSLENDIRSIMDNVLMDIDGNDTLILNDKVDEWLDLMKDAVYYKSLISPSYKCKDDKVQSKLNDDVKEEIKKIETKFSMAAKNKSVVKDEANKQASSTISKLEPIKNNIKGKLQDEANKYFSVLEEEIKKVDLIKPNYEKAIEELAKLENALK